MAGLEGGCYKPQPKEHILGRRLLPPAEATLASYSHSRGVSGQQFGDDDGLQGGGRACEMMASAACCACASLRQSLQRRAAWTSSTGQPSSSQPCQFTCSQRANSSLQRPSAIGSVQQRLVSHGHGCGHHMHAVRHLRDPMRALPIEASGWNKLGMDSQQVVCASRHVPHGNARAKPLTVAFYTCLACDASAGSTRIGSRSPGRAGGCAHEVVPGGEVLRGHEAPLLAPRQRVADGLRGALQRDGALLRARRLNRRHVCRLSRERAAAPISRLLLHGRSAVAFLQCSVAECKRMRP